MSTIKRTMRAQVTFGYDAKAGDLSAFFADVPVNARITVEHYKGDQREPGYTTLTAAWEL